MISLAAGTVPELGPADFVGTAAGAGWPAAGIWCDPKTWTDATAHSVRKRLEDTGLVALDLEPVMITPDGDAGDLQIDAAVAVGARNVLVVGVNIERERFADRFAEICDRAEPAGIRCAVEFLPIMAIRNLTDARAVIARAQRPNAAILVDNLHLARSGGSPEDLRELDSSLLPYAQICDAPALAPNDLTHDARLGRLNIGEGGLPVREFLDSLPHATDLSAEIRSTVLYEQYPDPLDRARAVLAATERVVAL